MATDVTIRRINSADAPVWERMRCELWPDGADDHGSEIALFFAGHYFKDLSSVLIAEDASGQALGFAELSVRDDVPTLQGTRTGYIEGLYVLPQARGRGIALKLLRAAQAWAHEQRCLAFASDRAGGIVIDASFTDYRS